MHLKLYIYVLIAYLVTQPDWVGHIASILATFSNPASISNTVLYERETSGTTWGLFRPLPMVCVTDASFGSSFLQWAMKKLLKSKSGRFLEGSTCGKSFYGALFKEFENFLLRRVWLASDCLVNGMSASDPLVENGGANILITSHWFCHILWRC